MGASIPREERQRHPIAARRSRDQVEILPHGGRRSTHVGGADPANPRNISADERLEEVASILRSAFMDPSSAIDHIGRPSDVRVEGRDRPLQLLRLVPQGSGKRGWSEVGVLQVRDNDEHFSRHLASVHLPL